MIDFFFGKPRSGKTYRAMDIIYNQYFKDDSAPDFTNILTNIGGFKFDKFNQYFKDTGSKSLAYKLLWKEFYRHLRKMYDMALEEASDEELNRYAYYHKINDCLIVLDEASFYMKKYDDAISWYLAYHGHFKVRIILIAQSPKQIYAEYLSHTEIFYEAQPMLKRPKDDLLRYIHYDSIPFNKDSKFATSSLKTSSEIYSLYKSGETDKPPKMLYKFIIIMILSFLAFLGFFFFLQHKLTHNAVSSSESNSSLAYDVSVTSNSTPDLILRLRCDDNYCWNFDREFESNKISINYFKSLVISYDLKLLYYEVNNEIYKLVGTKNSYVKKSLSYLTDYYYSIPLELRSSYLSDLFHSRKSIQNYKTISTMTDFTSDPARSALATSTGTQ
jgi:hypothetical protein